jgi:hypothetical protein
MEKGNTCLRFRIQLLRSRCLELHKLPKGRSKAATCDVSLSDSEGVHLVLRHVDPAAQLIVLINVAQKVCQLHRIPQFFGAWQRCFRM